MINDMSQYQAQLIPMAEIFSDDNFNCRGSISPLDVKDLAKDIEANDLQFPIAVQPAENVSTPLPTGKKYRIIAGHRRHKAFMVLRRTHIPAMVKRGLSEVQARIYNLSENLQRAELNILQEAHAVRRLKDLGLVQADAAQALGKTRSWIQIRYNLLELPPVIQEEAAAGLINQSQIKQIYSLRDQGAEAQYAAVRTIKNARLRGESDISVAKSPQVDPYTKKRRQKNEVQAMMRHIGKEGRGWRFATRSLAWANGEINSAELFIDIGHECRLQDKPYQIPVTELQKVVCSS
jgi:ParB/RepB/Spo0J family partition protein